MTKDSILFLDIETVPYDDEIKDSDIKVPGNITKEETKAKWLEENKDEAIAKVIKDRSIDRYQCKIICIAYAFNPPLEGDKPEVQRILGTEENIILTFQNAIINYTKAHGGSVNQFYLIGHNIKKFDIPILYLRSCKYHAETLKSVFLYNIKSIKDTMEMGSYFLHNEHVSQKTLCKFFGRDTKDDMDGSKVYGEYKAGNIDKIANYCSKDVEDVIFLYDILSL